MPRAAENDDNKGSGSISRMAKRLSKPVYINRAEQRPEIPLSLFSYDCSYCRRLLQRELPKIAEKYNISFKVSYYNLGIKDTYELFLNAGAEFGRQHADKPAIFVGKKVFGGETEIEAGIVSQVELFLKNKQKFTNESIDPFKQAHDTRSLGEASFETLTFGLVLGAGLLDGLNPCAFTTIIFLISYLSLFGFSTRKIIYTGVMFTSGVFITYFLIGLLFYNYLKLALTDPVISTVINSLLLVVVSILALYSLSDLIKSMRGKTGELSLRLPDAFQAKIQQRIKHYADNRLAWLGAPFVLGIFISGMELTCTGQVYIPVVTMISEPQHRVQALIYLLTYNIAFIIPLIVVFILAFFGIISGNVSRGRKYLTIVKFCHVLFFITMALIVLYNLGVL